MARESRSRSTLVPAQLAIALTAVGGMAIGCTTARSGSHVAGTTEWHDASVNAVSRPAIGSGVAAVTALRPDGRLQTVATDTANGKRLWAQPATISGRPAALGVQPPAMAGPADRPIVASVEPHASGAAVVGRDARTGERRWVHLVGTTFGPARCGDAVCLSESTARKTADFTALDATNGRPLWKMPGVAEVEWSDRNRVVVFRMAAHPTVEAHDLRTGQRVWSLPVENALGRGVDVSGGWAFGSVGDTLVGYLAPFQSPRTRRLSAFGFFAVRMADGGLQWAHRRLLRIYPSANPAVALIAREVDDSGHYGGFVQLDPRTGRSVARIRANAAPKGYWWLALPPDLSSLGFLIQGRPGRTYDLRTGREIAGHVHGWSFCTTAPPPLKIKGQQGFYPVAALCPYDLKTGKMLPVNQPPPGWYTGAVDGVRVWRDQQGGLHGVRDASGTAPGMYG